MVRAYEQGRLGTNAQVQSDMEPYFSRSDLDFKIPKPFNENGQFTSFTEWTDDQATAFNEWATSDKVNAVVGAEKQAAVAAYRAAKETEEKK